MPVGPGCEGSMYAALREPLPHQPSDLTLPTSLIASLKVRYSETGRHYHTWEHVLELLGHFGVVDEEIGWENPREVYLAMLFHDAIYDIGRRDNEAQSASLARRVMETTLVGQGIDTDMVSRLILLTRGHGQDHADALDGDAAYFVDCDMAILGSDPKRFWEYERQILREYSPTYTPEQFKRGRTSFLKGVAARPTIFVSSFFQTKFEAIARHNIAQALG